MFYSVPGDELLKGNMFKKILSMAYAICTFLAGKEKKSLLSQLIIQNVCISRERISRTAKNEF